MISVRRKIYLYLLFSLWFLLIGQLVYNHYFKTRQKATYISLETGLRELPGGSEWMNIYHQGQKMGYVVYSITNKGSDGYHIKSTTELSLMFGGLETPVHMENSATLDTLFRLETFSFSLRSDAYTTRVLGNKKGRQLQLTLYQGKDSSVSTLSVPEDIYTFSGLQPMIASKGIQAGETIRIPTFDPVSMEMDHVEITHEGKDLQVVGGAEMRLNRLRINFRGIPTLMWLDAGTHPGYPGLGGNTHAHVAG